MQALISARQALQFFKDPLQLREAVVTGWLGFYIKYSNNDKISFSDKELRYLYPNKERDFFSLLDTFYFDYNKFNTLISGNRNYLILGEIQCNIDKCPYKNSDNSINDEIKQKDKIIAELQDKLKELECLKEISGMQKHILKLKQDGKTDKEIARILQRYGLPRKAIGVLLRPDEGIIKDYGQWLDEQGYLSDDKTDTTPE